MPKVDLFYHAQLREQRGCSEETIESDTITVADLYQVLRDAHAFHLPQDRCKVAVNDSFVKWDYLLQDGDRVAFIPPVAGG